MPKERKRIAGLYARLEARLPPNKSLAFEGIQMLLYLSFAQSDLFRQRPHGGPTPTILAAVPD
ncbi:MAG TPA: hypothetical protein VN736_17770 [Candidatus Limnocylindrales bacterium]|nr:hypothetical protein [Candidatus Limnocylindrales bacterium]